MGANAVVANTVGEITFTGTAGPVGQDGRPVVFFHGTKDDITAFDLTHPNRKDKGWLGTGVYATSSTDKAEIYAFQKGQGKGTGQTIMPVFMAVRNPYIADLATKKRLKNAPQSEIDRFTQRVRDKGHDGVVLHDIDGTVEIMALEPTQVKSAIGNKGTFDGANPDIRYARAPATSTPKFKTWFGQSKVVDASGKPMVMYHGTSASQNGDAFTAFDTYGSVHGLFGQGQYFTDAPAVASSYTSKGKGTTPSVYPVYLSIANPIDMDQAASRAAWIQAFPDVEFNDVGSSASNEDFYRHVEEHARNEEMLGWEAAEIIQEGLRSMGHDGITHIGGGRVKSKDEVKHRVFIAFDPEQIKSATGNDGNFDPKNPDIRRSAGAPGTLLSGMPQAAVQTAVDRIKAAWTNAPPVVVVQSINDPKVPKAVRDQEAGERSQGDIGAPEGFFYRGTVYLVADQLASPGDVARVLMHEALGHSGLGVFGTALDGVLDQIVMLRRGEVAAKARQYGMVDLPGDASVAQVMAALTPAQRREAAEEVLAEMAQTRPELGFVKRAVSAIRTWLRTNVPGFAGMRLTDAEIIRNYILPARAYVERGTAGQPAAARGKAPMFSRAASVIQADVDVARQQMDDRNIAIDTAHAKRMATNATIAKNQRIVIDQNYLNDNDLPKRNAARAAVKTNEAARNQRADDAHRDALTMSTDAFNAAERSAQLAPSPWESIKAGKMDRFIYEMQDGRVDLKRTQEAIVAAGNEIDERFDARLAETLYSGRVAKRTQTFIEREAQPLLRVMARLKIGQTELGDYLHARAAPERNVQIALVNPDMPDGGAGSNSKGLLLTTAAAQQYIAAINPVHRANLEQLAEKVDAITKGTRQVLVDDGLERAETVTAWEAAYTTYIPMFREDIDFNRITVHKRATGSTKAAVDILAHVLMQREAAITKGEKNRIGVALYGLALSNPNSAYWTTIRPGMQVAQIARDLTAMGVDPLVAEAGMRGVPTIRTVDPVTNTVVERLNPMYRSLPGAITLKINGDDRVLMLNVDDPRAARMAENMKNLDGLTKFDLAASIIGRSTRWLAAVNTQYNPVFGVANAVRDTLSGAIHVGNTELRGKGTALLMKVPAASAGIVRSLRGGKPTAWSQLFEQFQEDGGQTGFTEAFSDGGERARAIEKELAALARAGTLNPMRGAHAILDLLGGFNTMSENAVRLAAYKQALDKGMSRAYAARLARELTVDFNRKGRATREIGPLFAFFNASLQGTERTMRALRGPTGGKIIAGGLTLGIMQAVMMAAAGYDDDEIPEYVKTRAFIIPLFNKEKSFITIPMPLGLHVLPNTGRILAELAMSGGRHAGKKAFAAVGELAGAFNPLGGGNIFTMDGALRTISPTLIDPLVEAGFNKNFAGNPIQREARGESDGRPGAARARESTQRSTTGQAYLGISKALNTLTGGNEFERGIASPTPEMVRYIAQVAGGGVLRELEKVVNVSVDASRGKEVEATGVPLAGRFYGKVDAERVEQTRYYDASKNIDRMEGALSAAKKAGDGDAMVRMTEQNPEVAFIHMHNRVQTQISKLNKMAVATINDRETMVAIDKTRVETMRSLNEAMRELEDSTSKPTLAQRLRSAVQSKEVATVP